MKQIITLTGCMGSGKDTVLNEVIKRKKIINIVSTTSRPMRRGEINGKEYNFVTTKKALNMLTKGEFLEHRSYKVANGETWIYGIEKNNIDFNDNEIYIVIVDFKGLQQMKNYLKLLDQDKITSFYIHTSERERLKRALSREGKMSEEQKKEVYRRNEDDKIMVEPAKEYCDCVLVNEKKEDLNDCVNRIISVIDNL